MDCYPTVGLLRANDESVGLIRIKFSELRWATQTLSLYPKSTNNLLGELPPELLNRIILESSTSAHFNLLCLSLVSKTFNYASKSESIWRHLFYSKYPLQSTKLKLKNWRAFYQRRTKAIRDQLKKDTHPIENCEMEFECPMLWENLEKKPSEKSSLTQENDQTRYCVKCNADVYMVYTKENLDKYTSLGRCVVFEPKKPTIQLRTTRHMIMGRIA